MTETASKCLDWLKTEYINDTERDPISGVCMFDLLGGEYVPEGITFEEALEIYAELMNWAEHDEFYRENREDGFRENITHGIGHHTDEESI